MSRLKVESLRHPDSSTDAVTLDNGGNVAISGSLVPSQQLSNRNLLINGAMRVSQRGTSFTSTNGANNNDVYTLDRWNLLSNGNDAVDVTQSTDAPERFTNSIAFDIETANRKFGILQIIENIDAAQFIGQQVTLSFYAKITGSSLGGDVKAAIFSWTGTADVVTSDVVSAWNGIGQLPTWAANWTPENTPLSPLGVTSSWARYSVTATIDTPNATNVAVFIWSDDATTVVGDFLRVTGVQLETGPVATPFEFESYETTLRKCQRYYQVNPFVFSPCANAGLANSYAMTVVYPVTLRAAVTPTIFQSVNFGGSVGNATWYPGGAVQAALIESHSQSGHSISRQTVNTYNIVTYSYTVSAEL